MIETQPSCAVAVIRTDDADPAIPLPGYATTHSAGMDVHANLAATNRADGVALAPGERALIPAGFCVAIPAGFEIQIRPRSGLALRQGVTLVNSPGTIDADYRGAIGIIVINHGAEPFTVHHGDRIAQMVLAPVMRVRWQSVRSLPDTTRGAGGFGSTGR